MEQNERTEVRDMIHDVLEGWQQATVERENLIHASLNSIDKHLAKLNGSVAEHSKAIEELHTNNRLHIVDCPAMPKIEKLEENDIGLWIKGHWKLFIAMVVSTLFVAYSLFDLFSIKEIISLIK